MDITQENNVPYENMEKTRKINENPYNKSQEKILYPRKGYKACIIFTSIILISLLLFAIFLVLAIVKQLFIFYAFIPVCFLGVVVSLVYLCHLKVVPPKTALVLSYHGNYIGTVKENGYFLLPLCADIHTMSLKINYFSLNKLKVNERDGNPVNVSVSVIWRINDTAKATYDVGNCQSFMSTHTESAIRFIGCKYPYEPSRNKSELSLRGGHPAVNEDLRLELGRRVSMAGIEVEDARITEVEYASEVVSSMLKKHGADSEMSAKEKTVYGALSIVEESIAYIENNNICKFNEKEKSQFVENLMVILSADPKSKIVVGVGGNNNDDIV